MGMRQEYLVGFDIRKNRYGALIDEVYSPFQVNVFSTQANASIMSAQSQLEAIYPPNKRPDLWENQTANAVPPIDVSSVKNLIASLHLNVLPQNF